MYVFSQGGLQIRRWPCWHGKRTLHLNLNEPNQLNAHKQRRRNNDPILLEIGSETEINISVIMDESRESDREGESALWDEVLEEEKKWESETPLLEHLTEENVHNYYK